ncbi:MAG: hypothetical protein AB7V77_02110 [Candidatus Woesearchaeota archaeon]
MTTLNQRIKNINDSNLEIPKLMPEISEEYLKHNAKIKELTFKAHEDNKYFNQAKNDEKSLYETVFDLLEINDGQRFFFPQKLDLEHNKNVSEMQQLIPNLNHMKTKGRLSCTTPFMNAVYWGVAGAIISVPTGLLTSTDYTNYNSDLFIPLLTTFTILGTMGGFVNGLINKLNNSTANYYAKLNSKCLDGEIEKHYLK